MTPPAPDDPAIIEFGDRFAGFAAGYGVPPDQVEAMGKFISPQDQPPVVFVPRWFQPAAEAFDDRYTFVGPCLTERAHQGEWQLQPE